MQVALCSVRSQMSGPLASQSLVTHSKRKIEVSSHVQTRLSLSRYVAYHEVYKLLVKAVHADKLITFEPLIHAMGLPPATMPKVKWRGSFPKSAKTRVVSGFPCLARLRSIPKRINPPPVFLIRRSG